LRRKKIKDEVNDIFQEKEDKNELDLDYWRKVRKQTGKNHKQLASQILSEMRHQEEIERKLKEELDQLF